MGFAITVRFVRDVAELALPDARTAEWPPHPARLFAALVASADLDLEAHRQALSWLEGCSPPAIALPEWRFGAVRGNWVVSNQMLSQRAHQEYLGRSAKGWRDWPRVSVDGAVTFRWDATPPSEVLSSLASIARAVPYLGRSTSPVVVSAEISDADDGAQRWIPEDRADSLPLRVPRRGYLAALEAAEAEERHAHEVPTRVVTYAPEREFGAPGSVESPYEAAMFVARFSRPVDPRRTVAVCRVARKAVHESVCDVIPETEQSAALSGHANHGELRWHQVLYLGLPFAGDPHADGLLRGLGVAVPKELNRRERAVLLQSLGKLRYLNLGERGRLKLEPVGGQPLRSLDWRRWVAAPRGATTWASATAFVPDRYCSSEAQRVDAVARAVAHADLPAPAEIVTSAQPIVNGAAFLQAGDARRRKGDPARPSFHVRLTFEQPVMGPVVIGNLRASGLGLMMPELGAVASEVAS